MRDNECLQRQAQAQARERRFPDLAGCAHVKEGAMSRLEAQTTRLIVCTVPEPVLVSRLTVIVAGCVAEEVVLLGEEGIGLDRTGLDRAGQL